MEGSFTLSLYSSIYLTSDNELILFLHDLLHSVS